MKRDAKSLENVAAYRPWTFNLTGSGDAEQVFGAEVSGNFFSALGIQPFLGRTIGPADDCPRWRKSRRRGELRAVAKPLRRGPGNNWQDDRN